MIEFSCEHCGTKFRVDESKAGRRGRCSTCRNVLVIPGISAPPAAPAAPQPVQRPPSPARPAVPQPPAAPATGPECPSCDQRLAEGAVICVDCGIRVPSGRPVMTAHQADLDELELRTTKVIRPLSWLIPWGIYPLHSEALQRTRPFVTWAVVALTVVVSLAFLGMEFVGSPAMRTLKNLMLWDNDAVVDADHVAVFAMMTSYGDSEALSEALNEMPEDMPDDEQIMKAYKSLTPEQRPIGEFRNWQLITHALLHGGLLHLAGNMVFLIVFGTRVNSLVGNIPMLIVYPLLAVSAGLVQMFSATGGPPIPMLGASGAIMGLCGLYLIFFPLQKVHMISWWRWGLLRGFKLSYKIFALPGIAVLLLYIAFDVAFILLGWESGTAHWAHLGGFLTGIVVALLLLIVRLAPAGTNLLSLLLGRHVWPLIGRPAKARISATDPLL